MKTKAPQEQKKRKELEKGHRLFRGALPFYTIAELVTGIVVWRCLRRTE